MPHLGQVQRQPRWIAGVAMQRAGGDAGVDYLPESSQHALDARHGRGGNLRHWKSKAERQLGCLGVQGLNLAGRLRAVQTVDHAGAGGVQGGRGGGVACRPGLAGDHGVVGGDDGQVELWGDPHCVGVDQRLDNVGGWRGSDTLAHQSRNSGFDRCDPRKLGGLSVLGPARRPVALLQPGGLMKIIQAVAAGMVATDLQVADQERRGGGVLNVHARYLGWRLRTNTEGRGWGCVIELMCIQ
ncbi:hypothetical protein D3C71_1520840 [compost metagenome]